MIAAALGHHQRRALQAHQRIMRAMPRDRIVDVRKLLDVAYDDIEFTPPPGASKAAIAEARERWILEFMLPGVRYPATFIAQCVGAPPDTVGMQLHRMMSRGQLSRFGARRHYVYSRREDDGASPD